MGRGRAVVGGAEGVGSQAGVEGGGGESVVEGCVGEDRGRVWGLEFGRER